MAVLSHDVYVAARPVGSDLVGHTFVQLENPGDTILPAHVGLTAVSSAYAINAAGRKLQLEVADDGALRLIDSVPDGPLELHVTAAGRLDTPPRVLNVDVQPDDVVTI